MCMWKTQTQVTDIKIINTKEYIYIYIYIHTYIHTHIEERKRHILEYLYSKFPKSFDGCISMCCVYRCICVLLGFLWICTTWFCACIYLYTFLYMFTCVHIYIYTHTKYFVYVFNFCVCVCVCNSLWQREIDY